MTNPGWRCSHRPGTTAVRTSVSLLLILFLAGCTTSTRDASVEGPVRRVDTLSQYGDGTPKVVRVSRGDSLLERRTYRPTGLLYRVESGDTVATYFDLHNPDSADVLEDYLRGRWRNISADTTQEQASAFYIFTSENLTFENPSREPLESIQVTYEDGRRLTTEDGMSVRADIGGFDTVRVTGYTLVRESDSISAP